MTKSKTPTKKVADKKAIPTLPTPEVVADRVEDVVIDAVKFVRDAAHTYIGIGIAVQDRVVNRGATDKAVYPNFLEEAKVKGHARVAEIQDRVEPIAQRLADRVEPITERITGRIESRLPEQMKGALETSRQRVRHILTA